MLYDRWKKPGDVTDIPRYGVTPVSYTHLDVYKRQGEGITFDEILIDRSFPEDNAPTRKPRTGMLTKYLDNPEYDLSLIHILPVWNQ